ncbi:LysE family transporter [Runella sp. CRIBMP]|uniref:LysE family translocator n=1 Tax=Runella sp. CRIBMP TaxID=2683261 RepID=UPI001411CA4C|nr:LysE family transporter [Runella sp. CRIBMP]NBB22669.1 LysE family transporter [Runella sp. CRIBMP]
MEKALLILLTTAGISFVGSLQLGPVNLTVIHTVLKRRLKAGLLVALGGCVPELIYSAAAVWAGMWLEKHPDIWRLLEWASIPILVAIGIVLLRSGGQTMNKAESSTVQSDVLKGFSLAILNPQLFPYWLFILVQFQGYEQLKVHLPSEQIAFVMGAVLGAVGLLFGVAYLTSRYREKLLGKLGRINLNQLLGWIFLGMAGLQFFKLIH